MSRWHVADRLAGTMLLAAIVLGACSPSATPSPVTQSPGAPSPASGIGAALPEGLSDVFDEYDPAKVAALYATNATLYDTIAGETSTGLEAIQAKFKGLSNAGFTSTPTTLPISQGEFVAYFEDHGTAAGHEPGLVVLQVRDGKILKQWVYPVG